MKQQKLAAISGILLCVCLAFSACQTGKNTVRQIKADRVAISHEDGARCVETAVTDEETVSEIVGLHNSLQLREMGRPIAPDRFVLTFYLDGDAVAVWWVSAWEDGTIMTCSGETFGGGNYVVTGGFDYGRLAELCGRAEQ